MGPKPFKPPTRVGASASARPLQGSRSATLPTTGAANKPAPTTDPLDMDFSSDFDDVDSLLAPGPARATTTAVDEGGDDAESEGEASTTPAAPAPSTQSKLHIPPKLLARLVHDGFKHSETRVTKDAMAALQVYIESFAKEAIMRADEERKDGSQGRFIEVEHLEKLYPQLLLDF